MGAHRVRPGVCLVAMGSVVCLLAGCKGEADTDPTVGQGVLDPDSAEVVRSAASGLKLQVAQRSDNVAYVTDAAGRAVYVQLSGDRRCGEVCEAQWPTVGGRRPPAEAASERIDASLIGIVLRDDGTLQTTYAGRRLHYHNSAKQEPELRVSDEWGEWALITPQGTPVEVGQ